MTFFDWFDLAMRLLLVFVGCVHVIAFWSLYYSVERIEKKMFPEPEPPDESCRDYIMTKPANEPKFTKHFP